MNDEARVIVMGPCFVCGRPFTFNPHSVPSFPTDPGDPSTREPICSSCIVKVNEQRRKNGKPEWPVYEDSYEAISPAEL